MSSRRNTRQPRDYKFYYLAVYDKKNHDFIYISNNYKFADLVEFYQEQEIELYRGNQRYEMRLMYENKTKMIRKIERIIY